ncbi:MAG: DUF2142 domain-containing protein [Leucobacter sp.]
METSRKKRILLAVATAVFAFIGLGAWAIASPVGAAPDDDFHLASIWCGLGEREGLCELGDEANERTVPERLIEASQCFAHVHTKSADCDISDEPTVSTERGNFMGNYPPLYYSVLGVLAGPDITVSTVLMRLFNVAIFVGAVSATLALLKPGQRGPMIWGAVATLVPLGVFIIPSVNPSSWAVLGGLTVWVATYGFLTATSRARLIALGVIALVVGVMGAGARGDSAAYVAFAGFAAAVLSFDRTRTWLTRAILPLVLCVVAAAFFLSSSQSSEIVRESTSSGAGSAIVGADGAAVAAGGFELLMRNLLDLPVLWFGSAGIWGLGWLDTPVFPVVWILLIGVLVALPFWGLRVMTRRKGIVLLLALFALAAIPLYILQGKGVRVGEFVQPRYLLPLLIIFVSIALFGFAKDHLGLSRTQSALILLIVAGANSLSLHNNMRRYISGLGDGGGFNLNANIEWWWSMPLSPMVVWFVGSAAFALTLAGLFLILYPKGERPSAPLEERAAVIRGM